jgi:hypothetical protein
MANPFEHFGVFLLAVGGHAFTLLAGCAVTVVIGWIERHILKKTMPLWADLAILLCFVFFACFQGWHDEYRRAEELQAKLNAKPVVPFQVTIPPITIPPAQVLIQPPTPQPGISLKGRTNKLATELEAFENGRSKGFPGCIQSANSTPAQLKSCEDARVYSQETYKMYTDRFAVRVVTIIQEFKAKGVDVSAIENCAAYGCGGPHPIHLELRAWASRLDDRGDLRN